MKSTYFSVIGKILCFCLISQLSSWKLGKETVKGNLEVLGDILFFVLMALSHGTVQIYCQRRTGCLYKQITEDFSTLKHFLI